MWLLYACQQIFIIDNEYTLRLTCVAQLALDIQRVSERVFLNSRSLSTTRFRKSDGLVQCLFIFGCSFGHFIHKFMASLQELP